MYPGVPGSCSCAQRGSNIFQEVFMLLVSSVVLYGQKIIGGDFDQKNGNSNTYFLC